MLLGRAKPTSPLGGRSGDAGTKQREKRPTLDSFLQSRDFAGASALLEFLMQSGSSEPGIQSEHDKRAWLAYTYFHQHDFAKVLRAIVECRRLVEGVVVLRVSRCK